MTRFATLTDSRYTFEDKSRHPTSKAMQKARLDTFTFGKGWPHDQVKGHGASSTQVCSCSLFSLSSSHFFLPLQSFFPVVVFFYPANASFGLSFSLFLLLPSFYLASRIHHPLSSLFPLSQPVIHSFILTND